MVMRELPKFLRAHEATKQPHLGVAPGFACGIRTFVLILSVHPSPRGGWTSAMTQAITLLTLRPRSDALPEHTDFMDGGCDLYPSCLECPLPKCRYEEPGGAAAMLRTGRDDRILYLAGEEGLSIDRLAEMFGLSRRTIFRVLRKARGPSHATGRRLG